MKPSQKIAQIIRDKRTDLPTLPVMVENIMRTARDDDTSASDLAGFIDKDQVISNKVLKMANSAFYGLSKKVDSIARAITIIGFNEVMSLTIGMSVFSTLSQGQNNEALDMRKFWLHAIGCATAARKIAAEKGVRKPDQVFLSGLLHDIGKVVFAVYFKEEYRKVLKDAKESQTALNRKEKEHLGMDHASLGGLMMEAWNFPEILLLPSRYHHKSSSCPPIYQPEATMVELADYICHKAHIGISGNPVIPKSEKMSVKLGLSDQQVSALVKNMEQERPIIDQLLELMN
jgi:HD-like signal output (HDOD) protein